MRRLVLLLLLLLPACGDDATAISDLAGVDQAQHPGQDLAGVVQDFSGVQQDFSGGEPDLAGADFAGTPMVNVTWGPGCWENTMGHRYQAMSFQFSASGAVPLEAWLYFKPNCDTSGGIDNLNDTGGTTPPGSWTFWFIHHPDITGSSARWSLGDKQSACINYDGLPDC